MRNFLFLLGVVFAFAACDSISQFKEPIETLASNWDTTTQKVTGFSESLNDTQADFARMLQSMNIGEETRGKMNEVQLSQIDSLSRVFKGYGIQVGGLSKTVRDFVGNWTEKAGVLNQLKGALTGGSFDGDIASSIKDLTGLVDSANTNIGQWQGKLETTTTGMTGTFQQFSNILELIKSQDQ